MLFLIQSKMGTNSEYVQVFERNISVGLGHLGQSMFNFFRKFHSRVNRP